MAWGLFMQKVLSLFGIKLIMKCINFLILGLSLYFLIQCKIYPSDSWFNGVIVFALAGQHSIIKQTTKCEFCRKQISE